MTRRDEGGVTDCGRATRATQAKQQREQDDHSDMNSTDIMRARCTVPRDPTVLYQGMLKAGLQYGPSFRLLSQVWIPEALDKEQRAGGGLGASE